MSEREFPIMVCDDRKHTHEIRAPRRVPWSLVEAGRDQAFSNHGQTLERLAQRGGLSPGELRRAIEGKCLSDMFDGYTAEKCADDEQWLAALAAQHRREVMLGYEIAISNLTIQRDTARKETRNLLEDVARLKTQRDEALARAERYESVANPAKVAVECMAERDALRADLARKTEALRYFGALLDHAGNGLRREVEVSTLIGWWDDARDPKRIDAALADSPKAGG